MNALRLILISLSVAGIALAENWPHWRGPDHNGISRETGLPVKWSKTENVTWKLDLPGPSGSTPIIWGESIFLSLPDGDDLYLWRVDRTKGTPAWKQRLGGGNVKVRKGNMTSPSPVTDGKTVVVLTGTGILKAFDFSGKELWARDIQKDYGKWGLNHGYGSSPLLHEDGVYVQVLHGMHTDDPSYVLRVDLNSGKTVWRAERPTKAIHESPDSYTTPALVRTKSGVELVVTGGDCATGHDLKTGKELWRVNGFNPDNNPAFRVVASPSVQGDMVYVPTRIRPLMALRAGGRGDVSKSHRLWDFQDGPDVPSPISDGKYFYSVGDKGIMWVLDAHTGKEYYGSQRIRPGTYSSSPVLADGKLYVTNEDGLTTVLAAGPEFKVLAENDLDDYCLASPIVSDGQIFIRTYGHLYCIGQRKK
ncbi:MAG: PQQ-binding-like beta-propeller repeat protein [Bryobacteraceae bacterium]